MFMDIIFILFSSQGMVRFKNRYILGRLEWFDQDLVDLGDSSGKSFGVKGIGSSDIFRALRELVLQTFGHFGFATIQSSIQGRIVLYWK